MRESSHTQSEYMASNCSFSCIINNRPVCIFASSNRQTGSHQAGMSYGRVSATNVGASALLIKNGASTASKVEVETFMNANSTGGRDGALATDDMQRSRHIGMSLR